MSRGAERKRKAKAKAKRQGTARRAGRRRAWRGQPLPGVIVAAGPPEPARDPEDRLRAAEQPHRRDLPEASRLSEKAESAIGRYFLAGLLTDPLPRDAQGDVRDRANETAAARLEAGITFASIVGAYRATIGAGARLASSSSGGYGCMGNCNVLRELRPAVIIACECEERLTRYTSAYNALATPKEWPRERGLRPDGRRQVMAVSQLAVWERELGADELPYAIAGLDRLAAHLGLTGRQGSGRIRAMPAA